MTTKYKLIKFFGGTYKEGENTWWYDGEIRGFIATIKFECYKKIMHLYYSILYRIVLTEIYIKDLIKGIQYDKR
jgi:hypothetical protein